MTDVFILGGARTPMTEYTGALKDVSALELGATAARATFDRTGVKPEWIDHVVVGNVLQTSSDAIYGARHVALKAGVPIEVPALTVNRLCGSGIQAAVSGAQLMQLGEAEIVLTGGIENMSQAPHVMRGLRTGLRLGQGKLEDYLYEALLDPYCGLFMAQTAEKCAAKYNISREEQDAYALRSQQAASAAWAACRFKDEIVPVEIKSRKGVTIVDKDDHLRPDTTLEGLAKLRAGVFERRHRHRRQRQRHRRRRRRADAGIREGRQREVAAAAGATGRLGGRRRRSRPTWAWGRRRRREKR